MAAAAKPTMPHMTAPLAGNGALGCCCSGARCLCSISARAEIGVVAGRSHVACGAFPAAEPVRT